MSIRGAIFENQHPFASDHALAWQACMPDGLLYGCAMSFTDSLFSIGEGFMIVGGRVFELTANENISVSPGTGFARIIVTIDTSATSTETEFEQVAFSVDYAANTDSFAELTQGPINTNQGPAIYQAAVAVLNINSTGIAGIETQMEIVSPGGTSLNFSVVGGTTQPTNPKENTIWLNTDTDITEWVFSATEPTSPVAGMVWFYIGTSSTTPINALKKNGLWVYPTACQQYVSGAWVTKDAQVYQGGVWNTWELWLLKNGKTNEAVGGWIGTKVYNPTNNGTGLAPTVSITSAGNLYASLTTGVGYTGTVQSSNLIDVSAFNTLRFVVQKNNCHVHYYNRLMLIPEGATTTNNAVAYRDIADDVTGTFDIDISNITGSYYVAVCLTSYNNTANITISEITLK